MVTFTDSYRQGYTVDDAAKYVEKFDAREAAKLPAKEDLTVAKIAFVKSDGASTAKKVSALLEVTKSSILQLDLISTSLL